MKQNTLHRDIVLSNLLWRAVEYNYFIVFKIDKEDKPMPMCALTAHESYLKKNVFWINYKPFQGSKSGGSETNQEDKMRRVQG